MIKNEADVIVIGGGITGCSIALRLAEKGQRVILLFHLLSMFLTSLHPGR